MTCFDGMRVKGKNFRSFFLLHQLNRTYVVLNPAQPSSPRFDSSLNSQFMFLIFLPLIRSL